ncbi:MAG: 4Fe-4S dicluster domain-containing protein [Paludibacter sp.]|nr:4Fe-4S dicluster domain-containing protein [Paludibacter sp.]
MLRKTRIFFSILLFALATFFFLDFAGWLPSEFHVVEMIQFIPALLVFNWIIVGFLLLITFIFGRAYCSSICPMGVYQDIVSWIRKRTSGKKNKKRYKYTPALNIVRWSFLGATVLAFLFGFSFLVGLLDPYSAFGRMTVHLFKPAYIAGNNLLTTVLSSMGNHSFYKVGLYVMSLSSTIIALITMVVISIMAWRNGRIYCNTVCPVGTLLGFVSKYSLLQIRFNNDNCTLCGRCSRNCKANCIDFKNMKIDASRCINCYNCIDACKESGLKYRLPDQLRLKSFYRRDVAFYRRDVACNVSTNIANLKFNNSIIQQRRQFLTTLAITTMAAGKLMADTTLRLGPKKETGRKQPIMPPGALSIDKFSQKCTSCHLCISKCPSEVIKPSFLEYGIGGMMQPMMYFERQFCNYDCTICSEVCPTGALTHLTQDEKHHTQMGVVQLHLENCIVYTDETSCGACSEHCPTQAVSMKPYKGSLTIPVIDQEICVGCGGCEFICPAKPWKAIFVEGISEHKAISIVKEKVEKVEIDGFGF